MQEKEWEVVLANDALYVCGMTYLAGLGLGLSLIIAIGAQNVFVLRQGLRRDHVLVVVAICAVSDAILIGVGVSGIGAAVGAAPWLVTAARWAGAAFLVTYGAFAARRAIRGTDTGLAAGGASSVASTVRLDSAVKVALTCLALTWLNPHVYLDTVFLLGSIAAAYGDAKWVFAAGAATGSVVWFAGLGYGSRYLGRWLAGPRAWRILDSAIAFVMVAIGVSLVLGA
jgi:L-lysine exporter family protein LysE/ArgO